MAPPSRLVLLLMGVVLATLPAGSWAKCPYAAAGGGDALVQGAASRRSLQMWSSQAVEALDIAAVKADIANLLVTSQASWPIDDVRSGTPSYGPLMIRLAWHCAGSYRTSDGRGGCDGGRIRFDPERSWADNTNLDKAKTLLQPIKIKYGDALSWGDLIVLTGTTAIESMGGPVLGFCAGRIDDTDGTASLPLGPSMEQVAVANCTEPGNCQAPLGPTTMGLIYVNPEGPQGNPVPELSAPQIRDTFARMGMNDSETVALVGGGHAFGKTHGACPTGAGPSPREDPTNPWPGTCGSGAMKGKGNNTFTSGFEGHWTTTPTLWGNEYFISLLAYDWEKELGPGGHYQWHPKRKANDTATGPLPQIIMLTADVALLHDPSYLQLVQRYASSQDELDQAFSHAWYKLMTRDMGPVQRCLGSLTPPPQPFQNPLPPPPSGQPNWSRVRADIRSAIARRSSALEPDTAFGKPYYGALFAYAAYQCASTFRWTDKHGGCNGARIRFSPEKDWPANAGVDKVLQVLGPIKAKYGSRLTWADLIVLAGTISVESASGVKTPFCAGRSDAEDGSFSADLAPRTNYTNAWVEFRDAAAIMGLSSREAVALAARPRSHSQAVRLGYSGTWHGESEVRLTNEYFKVLLDNTWTKGASASGKEEYTATGVTPALYVTPLDMAIRWDAEYLAIAQEYAGDAATFAMEFSSAWTKLMNSDRFKGPAGSVCK